MCQSAEKFEVILSLDKAGEVTDVEDGISRAGPHLDRFFCLVVIVVQQYRLILRISGEQILFQLLGQWSKPVISSMRLHIKVCDKAGTVS